MPAAIYGYGAVMGRWVLTIDGGPGDNTVIQD